MKFFGIALIAAAMIFGASNFYFLCRDQAAENTLLRNETEALKNEIRVLKNQIASQAKARLRRSHPAQKLKPKVTSRDQMFQHLFQINGETKRIKYIPGVLTVDDFTVLKEDRFFEFLGFLLDEELVQQVQIPVDPRFKPVKQELLEFGLSVGLTTPVEGELLKIKLNNFNK